MKNLITIIAIIFTSLMSYGQQTMLYYTYNGTQDSVELITNINDCNDANTVISNTSNGVLDITVDSIIYTNGNVLPVNILRTLNNDCTSLFDLNSLGSTFTFTLNDNTLTKYRIFVSGESFNLHINAGITASIEDSYLDLVALNVYPSPTTSNITIKFSSESSELPIRIYSLNGQLVHQDNGSRTRGVNEVNLNVSDFISGVYLVKVGSATQRLVIE